MFYQIIEKKRDKWLTSKECTIHELLTYIEQRAMMSDAQLEAIKTYLFLKIVCKNEPLWKLFAKGVFNDIDLAQLELSETARQVLASTPAAIAMLQYAQLKDKNRKRE